MTFFIQRRFYSLLSDALLLCGLLVMLCCVQDTHAQSHYIFSVNQDNLAQITDFSSLNHPLAEKDRVFVKSGHFYTVGADGVPGTADDARLRIFGISLSYSANFPGEKEAVQLARRLRRLGFNAVRLHLMDSYLSDDLVKPDGILTSAAFPAFNATAVQRVRGLIVACRQEGIYVDLNLHVAYQFRPLIDGVPDVSGMVAGSSGNAPYSGGNYAYLFDPARMKLQVLYARQLIRQLGLVDNPVLAMIEINNEASMIWAWQKDALNNLAPASASLLHNLWRNWVVKKYGSAANACAAWQSCDQPAQGLTLVSSSERALLGNKNRWLLRAGQVGDRLLSKIGLDPQFEDGRLIDAEVAPAGRRVSDYVQFLAATDAAYYHVIRAAVRAELGGSGGGKVDVPMSGTQMYYGGLLNVDAQTEMEYEDEQFYVDHYDFPAQPWDRLNWRIQDASLMRDKLDSLLQRAFYRDLNKPFVMSELNQPYPNRQGAELLPVVAALASAQDWDGLFYYNYSNSATWPSAPDNFSLSADSAKLAECGIVASMFRQFQFPALTSVRAVPVSASVRVKMAGLPEQELWPRYLRATYGLSPQHAWLYRVGITPLRGEMHGVAPAQVMPLPGVAQFIEADTHAGGGVGVNLEQHQLRATGRDARLFVGYSEVGSPVSLGDWSIRFLPESRGFGVVAAVSRDGLALEKSRHILLALVSSSMGSQPDSMPPRPKQLVSLGSVSGYNSNWWVLEPDSATDGTKAGPRDAIGPVWLERIPVRLGLNSAFARLKVYPLNESGQRMAALEPSAVRHTAGRFDIDLHGHSAAFLNAPMGISPWYELVFE